MILGDASVARDWKEKTEQRELFTYMLGQTVVDVNSFSPVKYKYISI